MSSRNDVKVGQIYEDRDPRRGRRRIKVVRIDPATAVNVGPLVYVESLATGQHRHIALDHLRPISDRKGWTLVSDSLLGEGGIDQTPAPATDQTEPQA